MAPEDDEVDALYEVEPGAFVAARDALARELRGRGEKERAAEVKGLRRPSVAAWALNQIARRRADDVAALVAAGQAVQEAQARAVSSGDRDGLRSASDERRRLVQSLAKQATSLAGAAHRDAVVATLEAASLDPDAAAPLLAGRLTRELDAPAMFGLAGMPEPSARRAPRQRRAARDRTTATRAEAQAEAQAQAQAERERRRVAVEEAQAAVAAAEAEVAAATERLEAARARLAAAQDP